jgi:GGDEF domain-containing protein
MIHFHALETPQLERFLERHKAGLSLKNEVDLDLVLRQILQKAFEFVPSESGSILLDDPFRKVASRRENELVFIATFGDSSSNLVGTRLPAQHGIVGRVYQTGTPYLSADVDKDQYFYSDIDAQIGHKTHSVVAVPIYIGKHVCGVLELINRLEGKSFTRRDMTLLEIFAGYTSFTLQNALDAKRAHELAKKDDLTGLYNDRWFHVRLNETLTEARTSGKEAVLSVHGPRPVQGRQRLPRPSRRQPGAARSRLPAQTHRAARRRHGRALRRRRVRDDPARDLARGRAAVCEEIRDAVENTTFLEREWGFSMPPLHLRGILSASIGVARYVPDPGSTTSLDMERSELLRRADMAMYHAKSLGKNQVVVWDERLLAAHGSL